MFEKRTAFRTGGVALVLAVMATTALAMDPPKKPAAPAAPAPAAAPAAPAAATPAPAAAETPAAPAAPAADAKLTTNSGVYSEAQATAGKAVYDANCSLCHGAKLRGTPGGPSISGGAHVKKWTSASIGDLYTFIHTNMPPGKAGSLPPEQYLAVVAYLMKNDGWPAGENDLPADEDALSKIIIEPVPKK